MRRYIYRLLPLLLLLTGCGNSIEEKPVSELVHTLSFDEGIYTQGLEMKEGHLLVSGGLYGESFAGIFNLDQEELVLKEKLSDDYFGEGITQAGDRVLQLTWRENTLFIRDPETLEELDTVSYTGEGWGIAMGEDTLYMSDGTETIRIWDSETLEEIRRFPVTEDGIPVERINELEYANGKLYANIWQTDDIVKIDPSTGQIETRYDFSGLLTEEERETAEVLNGIAHIESDRFYITGKRWPKLFEVILR